MKLAHDDSFDSVDSTEKKGKRGRKVMENDKYYQESEKKINEWKGYLKTGCFSNGKALTDKDIALLKNKISAQRSRANKKMEVQGLEQQIQTIHKQVQTVLQQISQEITPEQKQSIVTNIYKSVPDRPSR